MRRVWVTALLLTASGCFRPVYESGHLRCAPPSAACPPGFHCATDGTCWRDGADPAQPDAELPDLADLGSDDGAPPDLEPPVVVAASVWLTGGGGAATAPSGKRLHVTVGGTPAVGTARAASGARLDLGRLNHETR